MPDGPATPRKGPNRALAAGVPVACLLLLLAMVVAFFVRRRQRRRMLYTQSFGTRSAFHMGSVGGAAPGTLPTSHVAGIGVAGYAGPQPGRVEDLPLRAPQVAAGGGYQQAAVNPLGERGAAALAAVEVGAVDLDAQEVMESALQLMETATLQLEGSARQSVGQADGVATDLDLLRGNIVEMKTRMSVAGQQARVAELAAGTSTLLSSLERKLGLSPETRRQNLALGRARAALTESRTDVEHALRTLRGDAGANVTYVLEQLIGSTGGVPRQLDRCLEDILAEDAVALLVAVQAALAGAAGRLERRFAEAGAAPAVFPDYLAVLEELRAALDRCLAELPTGEGDLEQMECLHRVRAQLNHVDEACRSRGRVKSGSVTSELLTVLKARRAGLKWKKKAYEQI